MTTPKPKALNRGCAQVVPDNYQYARIARLVKDKSTLTEDKLAEITEITGARQPEPEVMNPVPGAPQTLRRGALTRHANHSRHRSPEPACRSHALRPLPYTPSTKP